eukprot:CAMPEP_0172554260 /NCGR_PEP_ID=MMETSP1067-20121228/53828_1 /TAXON_ID=265564 ORGANISM="Thalassiosira punctigera, Strain Tpunct2005C2" /NCGR_SAMPLE_ID=MMETSP1067 /ASSEMBLY_ACC=CAM_ASM_000444 /LENGTH=702 /DNA_ID=CAMNT_0013342593 /DNA_START=109 /DNA_END=2217 /DNA_ORIENTATION=+
MKTYQLKFLAWTFSAFLPPDDPDAEKEVDYYELLDVSRDANGDAIKKAYRKRSLQLHPDKLRQRGMRYQGEVITEDEARSRFQQMKTAYDTLSDPKKRGIYDALGHRGMEFVINPSRAWDPHILLGNLAKSSVFDRAKLMALVLLFFGLILLQPILVCTKVDQMLEKSGGALKNASWVALLIPFWLFAAFYALLLIIGKAALPLLQWISFVVGILFLTLKFDEVLSWDYSILFIPFYLWMVLRIYEAKKEMGAAQYDMSRMMTIEYIEKYVINETKQDDDGNDIEDQLHRTYNDLNEEERDEINKEYIIVHVPPKAQAPGDDDDEEDEHDRIERSPEYQEARARVEYASKLIHRIIIPEIPLIVLIVVQLDMNKSWNWGLTFLPLWISMFFDCGGGCYGFFCTSALAHIEVQEAMADHFAKEQESKNNEGESRDNDEEKAETNQTEGGVGSKVDDAFNGKKSDADGAAESDNQKKSSVDDPPGIDTAISVKTEATNAESEEGKAKSEAKISEDEDEDFMFEMDEDTFHFYQQAEQEAENKATEAQSKAIGSFCNIIFQTIVAALFVVKLNQVYADQDKRNIDGTSSFSSFWILFPILLISGCVICCFACAIFGAANIDTAMSSDDGSENDDNDGDGVETADSAENGAGPAAVTPPPPQGEDLMQKNDDESTAPLIANSVENAGDDVEVVVENDQENGMDDLD